MGTQFSLIYDLVVGAIILGMLLCVMKRGFASAVVGLVSVILAFVCAMLFSGPISAWVYDNVAAEPISNAIGSDVDENLDTITVGELSDMDFSKIVVDGVPLEDLQPDFRTENLSTYDLSNIDISKTGVDKSEFVKLGMTADIDLSSLSGKTAEFTTTDINRYGLGKMIVAQVIAVNVLDAPIFASVKDFAARVGEAVPMLFGSMAEQITNGDPAAIRSIVLIMMSSDTTVKGAIIEGIVEPCFTILVKTLAFVIVFIVISIVLSIIAKAMEFVNKIPLVGGFNVMLGGVVGLVQGLLAVLVVCIIVRVITILSGGNVMFFNNAAIEASYVFKYIYNFDLINFLS